MPSLCRSIIRLFDPHDFIIVAHPTNHSSFTKLVFPTSIFVYIYIFNSTLLKSIYIYKFISFYKRYSIIDQQIARYLCTTVNVFTLFFISRIPFNHDKGKRFLGNRGLLILLNVPLV